MNGKFNGIGTLFLSNGDKYTGDFVNGKFNGTGTLTRANGEIIRGKWLNGNLVDHLKIPILIN